VSRYDALGPEDRQLAAIPRWAPRSGEAPVRRAVKRCRFGFEVGNGCGASPFRTEPKDALTRGDALKPCLALATDRSGGNRSTVAVRRLAPIAVSPLAMVVMPAAMTMAMPVVVMMI
jgi:hypothetical protein